jgi:hypothetical protein
MFWLKNIQPRQLKQDVSDRMLTLQVSVLNWLIFWKAYQQIPVISCLGKNRDKGAGKEQPDKLQNFLI